MTREWSLIIASAVIALTGCILVAIAGAPTWACAMTFWLTYFCAIPPQKP